MALIPRDYQAYGVKMAIEHLYAPAPPGKDKENALLLYPTGTGKSVVIAEAVREIFAIFSQARIMMLTHSQELVEQNYLKLKEAWEDAPVGVYSAGLSRKEAYYPCTFANIQSVAERPQLFAPVHVIFIDEAQAVSEKDESQYRSFIAEISAMNKTMGLPPPMVFGLTATGYRMKQGLLTQGDNPLFQKILVDCTSMDAFNWFFDQGYLLPPIPIDGKKIDIDLDSVRVTGGDYNEKDQQREFDTDKNNRAIIEESVARFLMEGRHKAIVFATGVDHAKHLCEELLRLGQRATWVASRGMSREERSKRIKAYKEGEFDWIVNNGILTTGFDCPEMDFMVIARMIRSVGLWVQILGRLTRPFWDMVGDWDLSTQEGRLASIAASPKQNGMVLDFGHNAARLGCINDVRVPKPREKASSSSAPVRICEDVWEKVEGKDVQTRKGCGVYNHASARFCWKCGVEFPRHSQIELKAATDKLVKRNALDLTPSETREFRVDRIVYMPWRKIGKPATLKVMYHCGNMLFEQYLSFEHGHSYPKKLAADWWRVRSNEPVPRTANEAHAIAMSGALKEPRAIIAVYNKPSREIRDYVF